MTLTVINSWPSTIPLPRVDFTGGPVNSALVSATEGPGLQRRQRWIRSYAVASVSWILTQTEYELFETFFLNTLGMGIAVFDIQLRYPLNSALTHWAVRFQGDYESEKDDTMHNVRAVLDIVNPITF